MSIEPKAEVSATAEPESPAKRIEERMLTCASPPRTWPIKDFENSTSCIVMLPRFINSPARMKNGTAIKGKLRRPLNSRCCIIPKNASGRPSIHKLTPGPSSSAKTTGMPSSSRPMKIQNGRSAIQSTSSAVSSGGAKIGWLGSISARIARSTISIPTSSMPATPMGMMT